MQRSMLHLLKDGCILTVNKHPSRVSRYQQAKKGGREMNYQDVYKRAREYREIYSDLLKKGFVGNLREETAKRMGMSVPQADRYAQFQRMIPAVQNLIRDYGAGLSNLQILVSHSDAEQQELCDLLLAAHNEGVGLHRNFIKQAAYSYRSGKRCWADMKADCSAFLSPKRKPKKARHPNTETVSLDAVRNLSGADFELWFAELLKTLQYTGVAVTQHSYDKGVDVVATKNGVRYIFQCKNSASAGVRSLQEIWFAKQDIDHVPVVVSTGNISPATRRIAAERGIQCWAGKELAKLVQNQNAGDLPSSEAC